MINAFVKITNKHLMRLVESNKKYLSSGKLDSYWIPILKNGVIICAPIDIISDLIKEGFVDCNGQGELSEEFAVDLFLDIVEMSGIDEVSSIKGYIEILKEENTRDQEFLMLGFGGIEDKVKDDIGNRWKIIDILDDILESWVSG